MGTVNLADEPQWYAIHTKPKQEDRADSNLRAWKVETFTPKIKERSLNPFTGKPAYITRPLFSRYIFARFKASELLHKVTFTRGVQSVVCFGGQPTAIDDEIIALIQSRRDEDGFIRMGEKFLPGDKVIINNGCFKDFAGVFEEEVNAHERVAILLTTIGYQARILIDKGWLRKVS
jgi:transcriptional antiterminator RfaH